MKLLMFSVDRKILEKGSAVHARTLWYSSLFEEFSIVLFTPPGYLAEKIAPNTTVYPTNTPWRPLYLLEGYRLGKKLLRSGMVMTSQDGVTNFVALLLKWRFKAPLQIQIHTDFASPYFIFGSFKNLIHYLGYRLGIRYADCIRVVSKRIAEAVTHLNKRSKPIVLPIFVEPDFFSENSPLVLLHSLYPQFEKIVLMVSRLTPEKNISLALRLFKEVSKELPKVGLVVVGEGALLDELKRLSEHLGISDQVIFEPWQGRERLLSYYKTADVFFQTSNYEGYGMSLIEAAASGCPVVTTNVGAVSEVLGEEGAFIAPVGDFPGLYNGLKQALKNPQLAKEKAMKAKIEVKENVILSMEEYLRRYKEALLSCLS